MTVDGADIVILIRRAHLCWSPCLVLMVVLEVFGSL